VTASWTQLDPNEYCGRVEQTEESGVRILKDFADILRTNRSRILVYYGYPISLGPMENTSDKIKILQNQA